MTNENISVGQQRFYTWVDVDSYLSQLAIADQWPDWLYECDSYWDSVELSVSSNIGKTAIHDWLSATFGPGKIKPGTTPVLFLEEGKGSDAPRTLEIHILTQDNLSIHRTPKWRANRISKDLSSPLPRPDKHLPANVSISVLHSYKGGVGRTLHGVALAHAAAKSGKVLLIDGDLEAPGISWMYASSGKRIDVSYEDFIALLHSSTDSAANDAVRIAATSLPNQTLSNIVVLPARRDLHRVMPPRIQPMDLITSERSPYFLTDSLALLAEKIGASAVIVDLRAGASDLSASLLMDPRVKKIFVTTINSQSVQGTCDIISTIGKLAPTTNLDPLPSVIITQYKSTGHEILLAETHSKISDAMASLIVPTDSLGSENDEIERAMQVEPVRSVFDQRLLGLPETWDDVTSVIKESGLDTTIALLAKELIVHANLTDFDDVQASSSMITHRKSLHEYANKLAYAETSNIEGLMPTKSLRNLTEAHRTELPICVVVGSKGAGKTFTQLQMSFHRTWKDYAKAVDVFDVEIDSLLVPVFHSQALGKEAVTKFEAVNLEAVARPGLEPARVLELKDIIQKSLADDLNDRDWRSAWLACLARSIGLSAGMHNAESELEKFALDGNSRIFLLDGLEDLFPDIASNSTQQRALRVLLVDCTEWLRSLRGRSLGLIVFVRRDFVLASIKQNSNQFFAQHQDYALTWDSSEALRLAHWVVEMSKALPPGQLTKTSLEIGKDLTADLNYVWGEKMGTDNSRQARSQGWFLAALSDFNDQIQARDIVTFLAEAAKDSASDTHWNDRLLAPNSMRKALVRCSQRKIQEIIEESPAIGRILTTLKELPVEMRHIPFTASEMKLDANEINLLISSGVAFREEDQYWVPEIFRHGIGFKATGRPRVLSIANLVRQRNNLA